jgi:hypothetical protein
VLFRNPFFGFVIDTVPSKRTAATLKNPTRTMTIKAQGLNYYCTTLIKKKIKYSSCIRKFRRERLQSHI